MTIYCINPKCKQREHPKETETCPGCGTPLIIKHRYRLLYPLRKLDTPTHAEIFAVEDLGSEVVKGDRYKVLKSLKRDNDTILRLFKQEAETLASLNHPGIPNVELGDGYFTVEIPNRPKPLHCLVMEKIEGDNLKNWIEDNGRITEAQALEWLKQLLGILEHMHQHQYLHRDIKPSNIMLRPNGQLVLIDLGTIRRITDTFLVRMGAKTDEVGTGIVSPGYSAPEQINGRVVPQSDIYALGRTFIYLLTGKHPLDLGEDSYNGQLIWREEAPHVSDDFKDWLDYMTAAYPWQRPQNVSFILNSFEKGLSSPPIVKPAPKWLIGLNFALFCILLITGLLWMQARQENRLETVPSTSIPTQQRSIS